MTEGVTLVAGATGQLGRVIVARLREAGMAVRAIGRSREKLAALEGTGAELMPADMSNLAAITEACRGVTQIIATANNNMGKGATSPLRIDMTAYQNLCAAARNTGVRRIMYVSFRGATPDLGVDIFRLKWHIEDVIRRSQVPYVILQPTAFMDTWIDALLAAGIRKNGVTMLFGDGTAVANYISVNDVATFAARIASRPDIVNEVIEFGGPSNISFNDLATLVERRLGASGKRRHLPIVALKLLPLVIKPFSEVGARMMTLGHFAATESQPFPGWRDAATRFGVEPETVEQYLARMPVRP